MKDLQQVVFVQSGAEALGLDAALGWVLAHQRQRHAADVGSAHRSATPSNQEGSAVADKPDVDLSPQPLVPAIGAGVKA